MTPIGVFVVGALGDVATTAAAGAAALARGIAPSTGLVTELAEFRGAGLAPWSALRFGGADVRAGDLLANARELASRHASILPADVVEAVGEDLAAATRRVERGFLCGAAQPVVDI
ncbi:MAG TPA: myo-inositol-1-phosphate synthase, partial [Planctomycetota bacterium]|nr:myo-inositol-1-phosphate synthase [Planctomycetota bacterium]